MERKKTVNEWVPIAREAPPCHLLLLRSLCWLTEVKVAQSYPTLCDPMDYTVHGILQARILEWVAVPFSRGSSQPRDRTQVSLIAGGFFTRWATREAHFMICKYFLSVCGLSFHSLNSVFQRAEVSNFDEIQFSYSFLMYWVFGFVIIKALSNWMS